MATATAHAIFKEEGEYSDHLKELLAVALNREAATAEVEKQVKEFVEKQRSHTSHSTPIKVLGNASYLMVRIGKTGWGPRDVKFYAKEVPLANPV
ncbi:MAG: hypothetical protein ABH822_02720 [Patescibacteria group bacterium]